MSALERNPQVPAPNPHKVLGHGIDGRGIPRGPQSTHMGTGLPPSTGLASSDNLAVLPGTKPPELEALEAGRVDESLFLQSLREAGRRSRRPTPEPRCPRGLPRGTAAVFPGPLRLTLQTYLPGSISPASVSKVLGRLRVPERSGRSHKTRSRGCGGKWNPGGV